MEDKSKKEKPKETFNRASTSGEVKLTYYPDGLKSSNFEEWRRWLIAKTTSSEIFRDFSSIVEFK